MKLNSESHLLEKYAVKKLFGRDRPCTSNGMFGRCGRREQSVRAEHIVASASRATKHPFHCKFCGHKRLQTLDINKQHIFSHLRVILDSLTVSYLEPFKTKHPLLHQGLELPVESTPWPCYIPHREPPAPSPPGTSYICNILDMILTLPKELICAVVELCSLSSQASLSRCCRHLHDISNVILYRNDVNNHESTSVFHAIAWCTDQHVSMGTLLAAHKGGARFNTCRDARNHYPGASPSRDSSRHSPIHLAARRGLDNIILFLVQHGVSPDGPRSDGKPPLAEAIFFKNESTAMVLLRSGASINQHLPRFDAVSDAVRHGLPKLLSLMIDIFQLDIDADLGYGCPMIMVAINHGQREIVQQLLALGANGRLILHQLSHSHQFMTLSWTLGVGCEELARSLQIGDMFDLVAFILAQKPWIEQRNHKVEALGRLLVILRRVKYASSSASVLSTEELDSFLDALLERALSLKMGDAGLASLLLQHGAKLRTGTLLKLLEVLTSEAFLNNTVRSLHRYPRLLQTFDFVYTYCLSTPPSQPSFTMKYFLKSTPIEAVRLVYNLKHHNLPLTARGVKNLLTRGA